MSEAARVPIIAVARLVLIVLWLGELAAVARGQPTDRIVAVAGLGLYALLAACLARPGTLRLFLLLAVPATALALADGKPGLILDGIAFAHTFPAFLATIVLVRSVAAIHPAITRARERVATLPTVDRESGFLLASHLLGAVVTAGAAAVLAPLVHDDTPDRERGRLAVMALRGSCLASLWSPFFVGMAFVTQLVPGVPLYTVAVMGVLLAALAIVMSIAPSGLPAFKGLGRATAALAPLAPPVAGAAALIILIATLMGLRSLETVLLVMPPLVVLWLLSRPRPDRRTASGIAWQQLGRLSEEMLVMISVTMLSRVIAGVGWTAMLAAPLHAGWLPTPVLIALLLAAIILIAMMGVHPMATVAVFLALLTQGTSPIAPLALVGLGLLGWGLGAMLSPTSLSVLIASTSFKVQRTTLVHGMNLRFTAAYGAVSVVLLALLDMLSK